MALYGLCGVVTWLAPFWLNESDVGWLVFTLAVAWQVVGEGGVTL